MNAGVPLAVARICSPCVVGIGAALAPARRPGLGPAAVARRRDRLEKVLAACERHTQRLRVLSRPRGLEGAEAFRARLYALRPRRLINNSAMPLGTRDGADPADIARVMDATSLSPSAWALAVLPACSLRSGRS